MAQFQKTIYAPVNQVAAYIKTTMPSSSISCSHEATGTMEIDSTTCYVLVFERYSWTGKNRVSLNVTLVGNDEVTKIFAVSAGGSQATFLKINTIGEESFLDSFIHLLNKYGKER